MELTIKELAPYLPYGLDLKINTPFGTTDRKFEIDCGNDFNLHLSQCNIKPILRPLSDLTKEIEVDGEYFIPSREYHYLRFEEISSYKGGANVMNFIQVREQNVLLELHFDIYGLIDAGLAIDINTLNK